MIRLIDTHFHIDMYKDYMDKYKFINEAGQYTLCMTNSPGVFLSCKNIFPESKYVKFALGLHPLNCEMKKKELDDFFYLLPQTDYVGEIGLDFSKKARLDKLIQISTFDMIVEACLKTNKLMSVHVRDAEKEAFNILNKYRPSKCILHWYTGNFEYLLKFVEIGCHFSINANMIKKSDELIKLIPRDRILIESDGPYSKVNDKKYVPELLKTEYEEIARALNEPDLTQLVWNNFKSILMK
ncbi:TatD family hydrolase [Clostridium sp.]|uniref:TatD family hydrolase n=1 Tax=Clostridium sp. TaxID=1506 RepID=UPI00258894CB|nr:TatD family hydrolase [Clostridium sp.]MDF2503033.1 TatD deoxyribonuclease family signature 1 [Clostridium sp.]